MVKLRNDISRMSGGRHSIHATEFKVLIPQLLAQQPQAKEV